MGIAGASLAPVVALLVTSSAMADDTFVEVQGRHRRDPGLERRVNGTGRQRRAGNFAAWTAVCDPRSERGGEGQWANPCRGAWPASCRRQRDWDEWWAERLRDADLWATACRALVPNQTTPLLLLWWVPR
jgi:hypothetical protein